MKIEARYAKAGSEAPASELLKNPEFPLYLVSYLCTHAWEPRNRGSGKRPRRNVRPVGCKAKLHVLQRREGDRMRLNSSELADVNTLRRVGVARKKILKYIWENTDSEPCMVDVHNLPAKLKKEEEAGSTVSKRLSETLNRFCEEEKYGVAHVDIDRVDNEAIARCIVLQTTHMRSLLSSFPETILVDATHGTNAERYRLFSFMVHDSFGHGQHVQHALLTDEKTGTLMATDNDAARVVWLESNDTVKDAKNHIVGAVLLGGDHWCALCISLERWTYTVMDTKNDKKSIDLLDELFKNVFNPLLNQDKRWKRVVNRDYQQIDGGSCGIWVLAFIEIYLYQSYDAPGDVDYLRYRYLVKVLLA
ncbi:hypothetical protein PF004_g11829 [Phytophthora fragariae]|uniref:Ubiquitin-like protease family profile domain-containing protein n=1 Tax=Phytophthora fragariae TaxID=53985 RepID=A0A6G0NWV9_9STRA|nr:hypothetical protein PF004_g11829 [Phytophthora fragariae]